MDADYVLSKVGVKEGDVFLDAGCGDGFISFAASPLVGNEGRVYAVDAYEGSINNIINEVQEKGITNLEPILADITSKIPLEDGTADIYFIANVIHGFVANNELDNAMDEIKRVLKRGGIFAVVEFKKEEGTPGPPFSTRLNEEEVKKIIAEYGFKFLKTEDVADYHYLVTAILE
jgi:ubiquinone/menaquinone biosynthesis C-methylase UbiE